MSRLRSGDRIRAVAVAQALVGMTLAVRPEAATAACGIRDRHAPPVWLVRVLGLRMAVQAGVEFARPTRQLACAGGAIDAVHALSMLAVAGRDPRFRRGALISALVAAASALALGAAAGREPSRPAVTG